MELLKAIKALIKLKDYKLLRNVAKTKEEIAEKQQLLEMRKKVLQNNKKKELRRLFKNF
jgi:hypothetical protein